MIRRPIACLFALGAGAAILVGASSPAIAADNKYLSGSDQPSITGPQTDSHIEYPAPGYQYYQYLLNRDGGLSELGIQKYAFAAGLRTLDAKMPQSAPALSQEILRPSPPR